MVSNFMKGLLVAMRGWQNTIGELATALASFMHHTWSRERFVATCLHGVYEGFASLFASFPADLTRWRWGDVVVVVNKLLEMKPALRAAWSMDLLNRSFGKRRMDTVETQLCDTAIRSDYFWSYLSMVQQLAALGNELLAFFQSCPCHCAEGRSRIQHRTGKSCPNVGRWLPHLASGELERVASKLLSISYSQVLVLLENLSRQECMQILQDFESGRQHFLSHIRLKGAIHQQLPLLLTGLAHPCLLQSHLVATRAWRMWDGMTAVQQAAAHPVTQQLCDPARTCGAQLRRFRASRDMELHELQELRGSGESCQWSISCYHVQGHHVFGR